MEHEGLDAQGVNDLMNKKSGLLGISGVSNDLRSVRDASERGDERAMLAYDMYSNSAKKYIGSTSPSWAASTPSCSPQASVRTARR